MADLETAKQRISHRRLVLDTAHREIESIPGLEPVRCYPGDTSAAYRIPLTYNSKVVGGISRESYIETLRPRGIVVQSGPIRIPIHLRSTFQQGDNRWLQVVPHSSHQKRSCLVAEFRCECEEFQIFWVPVSDKPYRLNN